jgi:hypothetical protein
MEVKHIQTKLFELNQMHSTMLIESNESQTHSTKAFWIKWKSNATKKLIESNESQTHSNKANQIKWKSSTCKKGFLNQMKANAFNKVN